MSMRLSPPPTSTQRATPHPHRRAIAVALVGLGLLALSAAALPSSAASAPASTAPAAAEPAALSLSVPTDQNAAGLGCWVTRDMVWAPEAATNSDPAEMSRRVCGGR